eukprot:CAMPEP_0116857290 /NCGR_PEP_ID=MMETSP0418-20121206/20461_1 /TAXON_ID=1158023 /ORGANISM="Astrosyne radiata, Strain 13vi08-1A" /LENGTH=402 /DNA_ID=CAMNT_0004490937 /DNA_START=674 /DNA_END=1882 /DNA_ORIENTATION=-
MVRSLDVTSDSDEPSKKFSVSRSDSKFESHHPNILRPRTQHSAHNFEFQNKKAPSKQKEEGEEEEEEEEDRNKTKQNMTSITFHRFPSKNIAFHHAPWQYRPSPTCFAPPTSHFLTHPTSTTTTTTRFQQTDSEIRLFIDIPGININDLQVNIKNQKLNISGQRKTTTTTGADRVYTIQKEYALDDTYLDTTGIQANLSDGVLVVIIPKKNKQRPQPQFVHVTQDSHDSTDDGTAETNQVKFPVDIPGVKLEDLEVTIKEDGVLRIVGKRTIGNRKDCNVVHELSLDHNTLDLLQIKANLSEGVLLVSIPKKAVEPARRIEISEDSFEGTLSKQDHDSEDGKIQKAGTTKATEEKEESGETEAQISTDTEAEMTVETVEEGEVVNTDEKSEDATDDWEQVKE